MRLFASPDFQGLALIDAAVNELVTELVTSHLKAFLAIAQHGYVLIAQKGVTLDSTISNMETVRNLNISQH